MTDSQKVLNYIDKQPQWSEAMHQLREVLLNTEALETVKWGMPTYTVNGKNVIGLAGFKNHFGLWFFQGVFLSDPKGLLRNAQEGKTKAMRSLHFSDPLQVDYKLVKAYALEAIENQKLGKEVKADRTKKELLIPPVLEKAFKEQLSLKTAFYALSPGKQREYATHIGEAKREATQLGRLEKSTAMILNGVGLNDKYKNC
ncbi:MAG: DUF1801 domain-containing protein [Gilvibacter sp.]